MAVKRGRETEAPRNWPDQLRAIEGVTIHGIMRGRARFRADDETIAAVRKQFGRHFHIEEEATRTPLQP
jgi:hypothetical protein